MSQKETTGSRRWFLAGIGLLLAAYCAALFLQLPQKGTEMILATAHGEDHAIAGDDKALPPLAMIAPFALLLGTIALFPLLPHVSHC